MKQFMGFKAAPTASVFGTNADQTGATTPANSPEQLGTALPGVYGKKGTGGAYNTSATLSEGELIPLKVAADFIDVKSFVIARGNAKGSNPKDTDDTKEGATLSDLIDRKTLTVEKYIYDAGKPKIITLGTGGNNALIGGLTPPPIGTFAGVTIVDLSPNIKTDWKSKSYEVQVKNASQDAASIATALATKINADANAFVIATVVGATIAGTLVLTHKLPGKDFDANGVEGSIMEATPKTVSQKPVRLDNGVIAVRELELECAGYAGVTRRGDGQLGELLPYTQVEIDDATGCVMYHLTWERQVNRQGSPVDAKASRFLRLYLAIPTGNIVMIPALDAILGIAVAEEVGGQGDETPLMPQGESAAARKRREKEEKEAAELEEEIEEEAKKVDRGHATQLPAEQPQRERGQAEQLPAEQTPREKHEQALREKEAKEKEERERNAHRDGHKH